MKPNGAATSAHANGTEQGGESAPIRTTSFEDALTCGGELETDDEGSATRTTFQHVDLERIHQGQGSLSAHGEGENGAGKKDRVPDGKNGKSFRNSYFFVGHKIPPASPPGMLRRARIERQEIRCEA